MQRARMVACVTEKRLHMHMKSMYTPDCVRVCACAGIRARACASIQARARSKTMLQGMRMLALPPPNRSDSYTCTCTFTDAIRCTHIWGDLAFDP